MENNLQAKLAKQVLIIGPQHLNHRRGIGAVINSCIRQFIPFNFIPTYKSFSKLFVPLYGIKQIIKVFLYLCVNRSIRIVQIHSASGGFFKEIPDISFNVFVKRWLAIYRIDQK